ncbi:MAG: hypothetical protein LBJ32_00100 [Oscillospiraceae bacterium]|jgi:hypothetical protein|nr:hypothetical protein [Oscillospiraceae bacterium]
MDKKKVFQVILFSFVLLFLNLNFIVAVQEVTEEIPKSEVMALEQPSSEPQNKISEKELEKITEDLRNRRQHSNDALPKPEKNIESVQEQKPAQENIDPAPEPVKPPTKNNQVNDYDLLPKEPKKDIALPEITNNEVEDFESITPFSEKKRKSYLLRGIISMLLVIAGASMIVIVAASEIKKKSKKKVFKRIKIKK